MNASVTHKDNPTFLFYKCFFVVMALFLPLQASAATHDVTVGNNTFSSNNLTIEVGDTVRWTNSSGRMHDVTADDGSFASATSSSFTFSRTFTSIEEILYHCSVHSSAGRDRNSFMNGRIEVIAATVATDVKIDSFDATDGSHKAGEDLTVKTGLSNTGSADSGTFNIDFYVSTDETITSADTLIGTMSVSNVAASTTSSIEENISLPPGLTDGDYFVGAIIDLDDNDLANNTLADEAPIFVFTTFVMNAGLNDAWFNPVTDGQGFFITIFPDLGFATLAWFTYDTELPAMGASANLGDPGHRWFTAFGVYADGESVMNIEMTSGGIFDDPTSVVQRTDPEGSDGTLTLKFNNCNTGTVDYVIPSISAQGTVPIQRVANDNVPLCDALLRETLLNQ